MMDDLMDDHGPRVKLPTHVTHAVVPKYAIGEPVPPDTEQLPAHHLLDLILAVDTGQLGTTPMEVTRNGAVLFDVPPQDVGDFLWQPHMANTLSLAKRVYLDAVYWQPEGEDILYIEDRVARAKEQGTTVQDITDQDLVAFYMGTLDLTRCMHLEHWVKNTRRAFPKASEDEKHPPLGDYGSGT